MSSTAIAATASKPKVVLSRKLPSSLLHEAAQRGEIDLVAWPYADRAAERQWLLDNAKGAQGIVVMLADKVDAELFDAAGASSLKAISTMSVGHDHIDVKLARSRGVRIGYTPKVLNAAVADLTLLLVLGVARKLPLGTRIVREGQWGQTPWSPMGFCGPNLKGKTVGFLGFGSIAQTVALRLMPFGPRKFIYSTSAPRAFDVEGDDYFEDLREGLWSEQQELLRKQHARQKAGAESDSWDGSIAVENCPSLDALAAQSDVLIVLASLSPATRHIVSSSFLSKMKSTAILINVSRGPLVDTEALADALRSGTIAGAGLDVLEGEPQVSADHVLLRDKEVSDKVLLLPHVGSADNETREEMSQLTESNLLAGLGLKGRKGVAGEMEYELK